MILFFGVWSPRDLGHFLYRPSRMTARDGDCPFGDWELDGKFAPLKQMPGRPEQEQGVCSLVRTRGWTVLALWDRSGDSRYASNAAFLAPGELTARDVWAAARTAFPEQTARMLAAFSVTVNGRPIEEAARISKEGP